VDEAVVLSEDDMMEEVGENISTKGQKSGAEVSGRKWVSGAGQRLMDIKKLRRLGRERWRGDGQAGGNLCSTRTA
jgi:hypothetical protein